MIPKQIYILSDHSSRIEWSWSESDLMKNLLTIARFQIIPFVNIVTRTVPVDSFRIFSAFIHRNIFDTSSLLADGDPKPQFLGITSYHLLFSIEDRLTYSSVQLLFQLLFLVFLMRDWLLEADFHVRFRHCSLLTDVLFFPLGPTVSPRLLRNSLSVSFCCPLWPNHLSVLLRTSHRSNDFSDRVRLTYEVPFLLSLFSRRTFLRCYWPLPASFTPHGDHFPFEEKVTTF